MSVDFLFTTGELMNKYLNIGIAQGLMRSAAFAAVLAVSSLGLATASPINVNTATQSELESIKGIGPSKANYYCRAFGWRSFSRCQ